MKQILNATFFVVAAITSAQNSPRLKVAVYERSPGQTILSDKLANKAVFDTRAYLEVQLSTITGGNKDIAAIKDLKKMHDLLETAMLSLQGLRLESGTAPERLAKLQPLVAQVASGGQTLLLASRKPDDPNAVLANRMIEKYEQLKQGITSTGFNHAMDLASAMAQVSIEFLEGIKIEGDDVQVPTRLTFTQQTLTRDGRMYGDNPLQLLQLSASDQALIDQMKNTDLAQQAKKIVDDAIAKIKSGITNDVQTALKNLQDKLKEKAVGQDKPVQDDIKVVQDDINALTALTSDSVIQDPGGAAAKVGKLATDAATLADAVKSLGPDIVILAKNLTDKITDDIKTNFNSAVNALTNAQKLAIKLQKTVDLVVSRETMYFRIGSQTDSALTMNLPAAFANNDTVRIQVVSRTKVDSTEGEVPEIDLTLHAYKLGWNGVRTLTYDYVQQYNSDTWISAPAVNVFWKKFGRNRGANTTGSIGYGFTTFPTGVNQSGNGKTESALGLSLSLFDDWLSVGRAKNFTSNKYFWFAGIMVPFKF